MKIFIEEFIVIFGKVLLVIGFAASSVLVKRQSCKVRMDPGQDPTAGFFQG